MSPTTRVLCLAAALLGCSVQPLRAQAPGPRSDAPAQARPDYERRDRPVDADDARILARADELLRDASVWNRADDRECEDDEAAGSRSLFCALRRACIDVLGAYDHRRVALQEVRFAIEDATRGRTFEHRLRDFNNLGGIRFADVKAVLGVAQERVSQRLATPR